MVEPAQRVHNRSLVREISTNHLKGKVCSLLVLQMSICFSYYMGPNPTGSSEFNLASAVFFLFLLLLLLLH